MADADLKDTIKEATVAFAKLEMANWLPAHLHERAWELIGDLTISALTAYSDAKQNWFESPVPSPN